MPELELRHIGKSFGAVEALSDINLRIKSGPIHALVGENGAGKSTLGKIISGSLRPDEGEMLVDGTVVHFSSPREAIGAGIAAIQQEVTLVPGMSVLENVYLGLEGQEFGLLRDRKLRRAYRELCSRSAFDIPADARVDQLPHAEKKKVEILRAMARNARLIVLDEPTASLGANDVQKLLEIARSLRAAGTTLVYVSHFLEEVLSLADDVTVLRNGELVRSGPTRNETQATLVQAMTGRSVDLGFPPKMLVSESSKAVLEVHGLTRQGVFSDVSLTVKEGQIIGLAGLVGSGRTEVARAIFGADPFDSGEFLLKGQSVRFKSPHEAVRAGVALLPESRKLQGLVMQLPVGDNVTLPHLKSLSNGPFMRAQQERSEVQTLLEEMDVRPAEPSTPVRSLSGGNQQKVVFTKWLFRPPALLIADEPTCGVDVNARRAIYALITSLAAKGMAVLLISSEMEEVAGLCHRALVMSRGRIVACLEGKDLTKDRLLAAAFSSETANEGGDER